MDNLEEKLKTFEIKSYNEHGGFTSSLGALDNFDELRDFIQTEIKKAEQRGFEEGMKKMINNHKSFNKEMSEQLKSYSEAVNTEE